MSAPVLELRTSPHVVSGNRVESIMWSVVLALLPTTACGVYTFGLSGALTIFVAVAACVVLEDFLCRVGGRSTTVGDGSAAITGLLFGLSLPPALPLWMVVVGSAICILLGKHLFGGLGMNPFNPALVGRAVLQATFPVPMTSWIAPGAADRFTTLVASTLTAPFSKPSVDAISAATPLSAFKFGHELTDGAGFVWGISSGSVGETSAWAILLGGSWLVVRRVMNWRIVIAVLGAVAACATVLHALDPVRYPPAAFMLLSGGLMLGAVFMATDFVGSPMTDAGCWIYGTGIGLLVVAIRLWGGMPEGVMYAILLGNAMTPHIDRLIQPRVFGTGAARGDS